MANYIDQGLKGYVAPYKAPLNYIDQGLDHIADDISGIEYLGGGVGGWIGGSKLGTTAVNASKGAKLF